jgi:hypothetical protein
MKSRSIVGDTQEHNDRPGSDFYPTPNFVTREILKRVELCGLGWEPACGEGHMHKLLPEGTMASDLYDHGYGDVGVDFLTTYRDCDWIITNPPFKYAQRFVEHGLMCVREGGLVIIIQKLAFMVGVARSRWMAKSGLREVYLFSRRIRFDAASVDERGSGGMLDFAWYVWERGYTGEPVIRWIND